jgi:hypothetical protein
VTVPARPEAPPVTVPVVVFVNPVPVKVTAVPNAAFSTRLGACDVIAGPAIVMAEGKLVPCTVTPTGPAVASFAGVPLPAATVALNVKVVPVVTFPGVELL